MRFFGLFLLLGLAAVLGCDGGQPASSETPTSDEATQEVKSLLEDIVGAGTEEEELGDAVAELRTFVESDLPETDAAKSQELMPDVEAMEALTDPAAIKAKAKEMLDKL